MRKFIFLLLTVIGSLPVFSDTTSNDTVIQPAGQFFDKQVWNFQEVKKSAIFKSNCYVMSMENYINKYVKGDDGNLYVYETRLISRRTEIPIWLRLTPLSGDTLILKGAQKIYEQHDSDSIKTFFIYKLEQYVDSAQHKNYRININDCDTKYLFRNDSLIMLADSEDRILGVTDSKGLWTGRGMFGEIISKPEDISIPQELNNLPFTHVVQYRIGSNSFLSPKRVSYSFEYPDYANYIIKPVTLATLNSDSSHVYLGHFYPQMPDAWIVGTKNASTGAVTFKDRQYLGTMDSRHEYFRCIGIQTIGEDSDREDSVFFIKELVFKNDKGSQKLTNNDALSITPYDTPYTDYIWRNPSITKWTETAGTPQKASVAAFGNFDENSGYGGFFFFAPLFTTDSIYMNPDKVFYKIYLDDSLVSIKLENSSSEVATTEIPYNYNSKSGIMSDVYLHLFLIYNQIKSKVGIQMVYRGGNEVHESEITWYEIASTAISERNDEKVNVISTNYYDLTGRRITKPEAGIYIKSEKLSNGEIRNTKIIK